MEYTTDPSTEIGTVVLDTVINQETSEDEIIRQYSIISDMCRFTFNNGLTYSTSTNMEHKTDWSDWQPTVSTDTNWYNSYVPELSSATYHREIVNGTERIRVWVWRMGELQSGRQVACLSVPIDRKITHWTTISYHDDRVTTLENSIETKQTFISKKPAIQYKIEDIRITTEKKTKTDSYYRNNTQATCMRYKFNAIKLPYTDSYYPDINFSNILDSEKLYVLYIYQYPIDADEDIPEIRTGKLTTMGGVSFSSEYTYNIGGLKYDIEFGEWEDSPLPPDENLNLVYTTEPQTIGSY